MPTKKQRANWMQRSLYRFAAIAFGIGCIVHLAHKECAKTADRTTGNYYIANTYMEAAPPEGKTEKFSATAYCISGITKSGARTVPGLVSADPRIIPLGSMIYVESPLLSGVYQVLDTGSLVKGKIIDIFVPSYERCVEFGRRMVKVKVLRYGFNEQPSEKK